MKTYLGTKKAAQPNYIHIHTMAGRLHASAGMSVGSYHCEGATV
jgi:hypothetical protein